MTGRHEMTRDIPGQVDDAGHDYAVNRARELVAQYNEVVAAGKVPDPAWIGAAASVMWELAR